MALLHALSGLAEELGFELAVAHVDHRMREGSAADARRTEGFAQSLGLPFFLRQVDVAPGGSREAAAREARYTSLREVAAQWGASRLAVGHTASDRAETLLLFLARGAGRRGLASMEPVHEGFVIRPLSDVTRAEARAYAVAQELPFADDPTNEEPRFSRNRVRAEVLPALRRMHPGVEQRIAATAQDLAAEEALLDEIAAGERASVFSRTGGIHVAPVPRLGAVRAPLLARVLRQVLAEVRERPGGITRRHLHAVAALLDVPAGEAHLPGAHAWRDGEFLCIAAERPAPTTARLSLRVEAPGTFGPRSGLEFDFAMCGMDGAGDKRPGDAAFDAEIVGFPLWIRTGSPGDFMRLEGGGRQKVNEQLANAKVPASLRPGWLVVSDAEEVLWVPGVRQSARGRPTPTTRKLLSIRARGLMFGEPYVMQVERRVIL
jgi:tRNA(Ile)-lysidine synthase